MATLSTVFISNPPSTADLETLLAWVQDMGREVTEHLNAVQQNFHELTYVEPEKQEEGMIRKADGTTWNPGLGAGLYQYRGGAWRPFESQMPSYTVTTLPSATPVGLWIFVTNETGGAVPAFSDGTNWRRVTDRAVVA